MPITEFSYPKPKKIAIFRALHLGDLLCSIPAVRALKTAFPDTQITLIGLPWANDFVKRFHKYLDRFIAFPGYPGFPEQAPDIARFPAFLKEVQAENFDLVLQMQGSGYIANSLVALFGAKNCGGFFISGHYRPNAEFFLPYPEHDPEIWRHLRLMEFLGIPLQGDDLELPLFDADWTEFHQLERDCNLHREYVCIHPGARDPERRWPAIRFASVADGLAARGYQIVLTGTPAEAHLTRAVAERMVNPAIDLAGKTSLGSLAALVSQASLLVSNDTGVAHVASAVKTPSIILFSASDPNRWATLDTDLHVTVRQAMFATSSEVLLQAERHLEEVHAYAH